MRRGVDYSWDRPDPMALVGAGCDFAVRYVSNDRRLSGGRTKLLDRAEAEALTRAGIELVVVWEGRAADRDPLKGAAQGVADAREAVRRAVQCGAPDDVAVYFAVDWDLTLDESAADRLDPYFIGALDMLGDTDRLGVYGGFRAVNVLLNRGRVGLGWQTYAWSGGRWDPRAQLRQVLNNQRLGGGAVDFNEAHADNFGQWRCPVTYAPTDLLVPQRYLKGKTGLPWASLGIIHDSPQGGGYHEGNDLLSQAGRLNTDYSKAESPRDRPGTDAASALDIGDFTITVNGVRKTQRDLAAFEVAACKRGDPRARDIREIIWSPDGVQVLRWDRLGVRSSGDSSHRGHGHRSFHRDSEGRRHLPDNYMGLITEFFEGPPAPVPPKEDKVLFLTRIDGVPHVCDGMTARPLDDANVAHLRTLASEGAVQLAYGGKFRDGYVPAFGVVAKPAEVDVSLTDEQAAHLADRVAEALIEKPDVPMSDDDKAAVRDAVRDVLQSARLVAPGDD